MLNQIHIKIIGLFAQPRGEDGKAKANNGLEMWLRQGGVKLILACAIAGQFVITGVSPANAVISFQHRAWIAMAEISPAVRSKFVSVGNPTIYKNETATRGYCQCFAYQFSASCGAKNHFGARLQRGFGRIQISDCKNFLRPINKITGGRKHRNIFRWNFPIIPDCYMPDEHIFPNKLLYAAGLDTNISAQLTFAGNPRIAELKTNKPSEKNSPASEEKGSDNKQNIVIFVDGEEPYHENIVRGTLTLIALIAMGAYVAFNLKSLR